MILFEDSEYVVNLTNNLGDLTLREFLESSDISGRLARKLYKEKNILVNGKFLRKDLKVKNGDKITLLLGEEKEELLPEEMDMDIVYEDMDLLILNKSPNMVVHPTKSHQENTLSNGIAYHFMKNGIKKKVRFVNRLDMDTTGLLIVAKNSFSHQQMALQFENNTVVKKYMAIVNGIIENDQGIIDLPIGREEDKSIRKEVDSHGQSALSEYKVVKRLQDKTLVEVRIYTGRSHQIRVHMSHIGHPVLGDSLYGEKSALIDRQALHSFYLKCIHPRTKKVMEFTAELPMDMKKIIIG